MTRAAAARALLALGAAFLLLRLGSPALWQDEAETALRAESILESGAPRMRLRGVLVTAQPSLAAHEGGAGGFWTWNTWLPAYLTAASFALLGRTPLAARLPFALAAWLALWLSWRLFNAGERDLSAEKRAWAPELGLALLALSPAYLLFARQARYYALGALATVLALHAWRRLLAGRRGGALLLALSLQLLLHSSFAMFAIAAAALGADVLLRRGECLREGRFWRAALFSAALAAPVLWYFRAWERPGNHAYAFAESLEFLKTFLLWIGVFALPIALPVAVALRRRRFADIAAGALLLCGLAAEGAWSRLAAAAVLAWIVALAFAQPAQPGVMSLRRMSWLLLASTLGLLSFSAAEPYGRYLTPALPALAYLGGRWVSELAQGRAVWGLLLAAALAASSVGGALPLRAAAWLAGPDAPAQSVSGMMRQRLRDTRARSELALFAAELARGPEGYIEPVAAAIKAAGGGSLFADADTLSLMFAARIEPVYPGELGARRPDWLLPSPWLRLDPLLAARVLGLANSAEYEPVVLSAPRLLWQNNPDPLFRDFAPKRGPLPLFRRARGQVIQSRR